MTDIHDIDERETSFSSGPVLALDTSTTSMALAVLQHGKLLGESHSASERNHSIRLVPMINSLLDSLQFTSRDLAGITVGIGPGSYTGVRIGITVAKTMSWALQKPVVGVSSLEALAKGADSILSGQPAAGGDESAGSQDARSLRTEASPGRWIVPLMDARRGQAYTALFAASESGGSLKRLEADGIRLFADWLNVIAEHAFAAGQELCFVGETGLFQEQIGLWAGAWSGKVTVQETRMRGMDVGLLGLPKLQSGEGADPHSLVPNYTQLAEAEAKLNAKQQGGEDGAAQAPKEVR
ncbi:tRNA (adenosine(37)-N6)-threonylcarbamoyltransferase complex dimerization subunit type 1 TsaB [Paenibacillus sp. y28]|uniref:tRNA (adenosine(37)-N6)-threonylcarbamoyltransferase complex dimerization subunit type 1 TsaB n=1 Tax=Paenibacillus sp. y28 TaxID=3129110 RepID=UPI003018CE3D